MRGEGRDKKRGPFLCWAVIVADISTFVYDVPGILVSFSAEK